MITLIEDQKSLKDIVKGMSDLSKLDLVDATDKEIKSNETCESIVNSFKEAKGKYNVQIDRDALKLVLTFNATEVPEDIAREFLPDGKYSKYVAQYDKGSKKVTLSFDIDEDELPDLSYSDMVKKKDNKDKDESVMVPTPTPYKPVSQKSCDKDDEDVLTLLINEDLEMSEIVPYSDDRDTYLRVEINGKTYLFSMKEDSPYSIDQMYYKLNKMMTFSQGKALQFMKKNMIGELVSSSSMDLKTESKDTSLKSNHICSGCGKSIGECTCEVEVDEDQLNEDLINSDLDDDDFSSWEELATKTVYDFDGFTTEYTLYYNPDEDIYICMFGDREVYPPDSSYADFVSESEEQAREWFDSYEGFDSDDDDDEYYEYDLGEDFSGATQPASVGQHKSFSIDLIESSSETVELEYDDLPYIVYGRQDPEDGSYDEREVTIQYTYKVDLDTMLEYLAELLDSEKELTVEDFDNAMENKEYREQILNHFKENAIEDAQENYEYDNTPDYDPYDD